MDFTPDKNIGYLYAQVADHLAERIRGGELAPRTTLPNEQKLAAEYNVSLGTVRHATKLLRLRGLVVTLPSRGTYIAAPSTQEDQARAFLVEILPSDNAWHVVLDGEHLRGHAEKSSALCTGIDVAQTHRPGVLVVKAPDGTIEAEYTFARNAE
ncbi:winged helix-turn-helix domain-containing protein [Amycolatopsis acidicola]|uniref:winged helix-turn-helix domain-containing protein n=1 Tax=Amycolatopsis acidicola TaxID=2596893 RepID=UPI001FB5BDCC|nr:winged helix-turn-helix domain-containing protein [Amycolatopsis acidicola]